MTQFQRKGFPIPSLPRRALYAGRAMAGDPRLAAELAWKLVRRKLSDARHARMTTEYGKYRTDVVPAISIVTGRQPSEVAAVFNEQPFLDLEKELEQRRIQLGLLNRSFGGFGALCYAVCRLSTPETVVETGVAFGWTSAYMLQALAVNGKGRLHSVDLPPFRADHDRIVGAIVPERLRADWNLMRGSQKRLLPGLLGNVGPVDFVHYDSDKTYHGMRWAYRELWQAMSDNGTLVSDDIWNDAFLEFAETEGIDPIVIEAQNGRGRLAMVNKRASSTEPAGTVKP